jgi:putative chitinase
MQITEHFSDYELGVAGQDSRLLTNAQFLCAKILEPIRAKFGPVRIHDGYRNPEHNAAVGGKPTSWHQFEGTESAADFDCAGFSFQSVFDWIRLKSNLPFDKVILEKNQAGEPRCIHVQVDSKANARRESYVGNTGAGTIYTSVEVK